MNESTELYVVEKCLQNVYQQKLLYASKSPLDMKVHFEGFPTNKIWQL